MLKRPSNRDFSEHATASAIIQKDMFDHEEFRFPRHFLEKCQEDSIPASLKSLISMLLYGLNTENTKAQESQPCLTVCQTILFNLKVQPTGESKTGLVCHDKERQPPLPLYLGFTVHALIRSKLLIAKLDQLGISVSYQRIAELEDTVAASVSECFVTDGVVAPARLRKSFHHQPS